MEIKVWKRSKFDAYSVFEVPGYKLATVFEALGCKIAGEIIKKGEVIYMVEVKDHMIDEVCSKVKKWRELNG